MIWFAFAALLPAALLAMGALFGGLWPALGVLSITVLVFFLDKLANAVLPEDKDHDGLALSYALALAHLGLLPLMIWAVAGGVAHTVLDKILLVTGAGLWFGQVSNSNAHELVHRTSMLPHRLGKLLYATLLYGHHASAHLRVHHIHCGTDKDPNSARFGEGFWTFALRCAVGEYREGLKAENAARARKQTPPSLWSHPYLQDSLISFAALVISFALAGWSGVLVLAIISLYAAWQLMLSDYVQHYGLRRRPLPDGRLERMGPQHSWNAPRWYSSAMMLNAPRHSDHHVHPSRPYPALQLDTDTMPTLPQSLPVMAVIALIPPIWKRLMDRRVRRWMETPLNGVGAQREFAQNPLKSAQGAGAV